MSIVFAILLFSFLIFIHEFGHFAAAKLSGVQVNEFAMFMGPAICKWRRGETQYSIRSIPIGGYCAMEGENGDSDNPRAFHKAAWWKRLIILLAGSFMNFLTGVLIIAIVLSCSAGYVDTKIETVESWSTLAGENGLMPGDRILEINGKAVRIYEDFTLETSFLADGNYELVVERNGQEVTLTDVPMIRQKVVEEDGTEAMRYGISFGVAETTFDSVVKQIMPNAIYSVKVVFVSLKMLFTGQAGIKDMGGPVQIVQIMSESAAVAETAGGAVLNMLYFGSFIAINLSVMNLLPIPALDGGRSVGLLVTTAIEAVTKKKVNPKVEGYIHGAFMVLLLGFMVFIMLKDIITIF